MHQSALMLLDFGFFRAISAHALQLTKIDQLDSNFRIRVLIAQSNQICTLKGSLVHMKFLQELDLSHNLIRNLQKVKRFLERFEFLETLNLIGNVFTTKRSAGKEY